MAKSKKARKSDTGTGTGTEPVPVAAAPTVASSSKEAAVDAPTPKRQKKGKEVVAEDREEETLPVARYKESKDTLVGSATTSALANGHHEDDEQHDEAMLDPEATAPTLAERIRLLSVQQGQPLSAEQLDAIGLEDPAAKPVAGSSVTRSYPIPEASSLAQTLVQALHSADSGLLEACLAHSDRRTIQNTVRRLPNELVLRLVEELVVRLGRGKAGQGEGMSAANARRARALIEWVRQTLIIHVAYLVTIPSLVNRLAALHATLQSRIALHNKLLALNGRLDLVLSQLDMRRDAPVAVQPMPTVKAAPRRYVEGESSDEDAAMDGLQGPESDDEGSVEDVVLGSASGSEDDSLVSDLDDAEGLGSESGSDDDDDDDEMADGGAPHINGFMDLEAEVSGSDDEDDADEDEDEEDGEQDLESEEEEEDSDDDE